MMSSSARAILGLPVNTALRLFGKPESFMKCRMGVALALDADLGVARSNAKLATSRVEPVWPDHFAIKCAAPCAYGARATGIFI